MKGKVWDKGQYVKVKMSMYFCPQIRILQVLFFPLFLEFLKIIVKLDVQMQVMQRVLQ